jgi:hypothetical protein
MIFALSLFSIFLGTGLAYAAQCVPNYNVRLEQSGGALFIFGFALVGAMLPRFC